MAYKNGSIARAAFVAATSVARPTYLRRIAKASLDWDFELAAGSLKRASVAGLCSTQTDVRVPVGPSTWGEMPIIDLFALCALVRAAAPATVFEFGTFTGNATLAMAMNAPTDALLYTLDLPPKARGQVEGLNWESNIDDQIIGQRFLGSSYAPRIKQLFADSRAFDTTPFFRQVDFVWVDACHEYDFVRNDSTKAFELIRPGGIVAWHDFSRACPGVLRHIVELSRDREVRWVDGTQVVFCQT